MSHFYFPSEGLSHPPSGLDTVSRNHKYQNYHIEDVWNHSETWEMNNSHIQYKTTHEPILSFCHLVKMQNRSETSRHPLDSRLEVEYMDSPLFKFQRYPHRGLKGKNDNLLSEFRRLNLECDFSLKWNVYLHLCE